MTQYGPLYGEEWSRAIALERQLFMPDFDESRTGPASFRDPTWGWVPLPEQLWDAAHQMSTKTVKSCGGFPAAEGTPPIETYLDPLMACLRARGVDALVVSSGSYPGDDYSPPDEPEFSEFLIPPEAAALCEGIYNATSGCDPITGKKRTARGWELYDALIHDWSGEWAAHDVYPYRTILGGSPAFMAQYFEAAGGEDFVRAWFYHYEIVYDNFIRLTPEGRIPSTWAQELYDALGWPYPIYPDEETLRHNDFDIDWTPMFGDRIKSAGPRVLENQG